LNSVLALFIGRKKGVLSAKNGLCREKKQYQNFCIKNILIMKNRPKERFLHIYLD